MEWWSESGAATVAWALIAVERTQREGDSGASRRWPQWFSCCRGAQFRQEEIMESGGRNRAQPRVEKEPMMMMTEDNCS
ncbi:hypothetical protein YC2023_033621 [Brassica napus]